MNIGGVTKATVYLCPGCGSAAVDRASLLVEGAEVKASCRACGWQGREDETVSAPVQYDLGTTQGVEQLFLQELTRIFSKEYGLPLLRILLRWGYLPEAPGKGALPLATRVYAIKLGRYVAAVSQAVAKAIIETREAIELDEKKWEAVEADKSKKDRMYD